MKGKIYIWVEGSDDFRFFRRVVKPMLKSEYRNVEIKEHSSIKKARICNYIKSINSTGADYLFVVDFDEGPCVTSKKEELLRTYSALDPDRIIVVKKEIESWYLAGVPETFLIKCNIEPLESTEEICKEEFNKKYKYDSRRNYLIEMLDVYCVDTAIERNNSFGYLCVRHLGMEAN